MLLRTIFLLVIGLLKNPRPHTTKFHRDEGYLASWYHPDFPHSGTLIKLFLHGCYPLDPTCQKAFFGQNLFCGARSMIGFILGSQLP